MQQNQYSDGVYFDMPDDEYHRIPALSSSGCKNLLISPVDFWARSWMNPKSQDEDDVTDSNAKMLGRAYDKRITEGKDRFYKHYAPLFDAEDLPESSAELRAALKEIGESTGGDKVDLIARCAANGIDTAAAKSPEYYNDHSGKIFLPTHVIEDIEYSAAMIEMSPKLNRCFTGGYAQVVIIWTEKGIRFKARLDYMKAKAIIDLKTFENRQMKSVKRAICTAMAQYKYHIQAIFYLRAVEQAKILLKRASESEMTAFSTTYPRAEIVEFCDAFQKCKEHEFFFVFQQKGIAPFARLFRFPRYNMFSIGQIQIEAAVEIYRINQEKFGEGRWVDDEDCEDFEDDDFPIYATTDL